MDSFAAIADPVGRPRPGAKVVRQRDALRRLGWTAGGVGGIFYLNSIFTASYNASA